MKLKLKTRSKGKWTNVKIGNVKSRICDYIADEFDLTIGGLYDEDDKLIMVLTNKEEGIDLYKDKDVLCLLAHELDALLVDVPTNLLLTMAPNSDFYEVTTLPRED